MSQGIEMIGKPLGPQQAGHVLDLKPSQIFVGRRSLTTRHQFFVIVMGLFLAPKNSSFPIFVGSLFPLFVATQSNRPFFAFFFITITVSCFGCQTSAPVWFPSAMVCHGLPWSAMVCHGPSPPRCWSPCSWTATWPRTRRSSPGVPAIFWWNDPMKSPDGSCEKSGKLTNRNLVVGSSMETSWI